MGSERPVFWRMAAVSVGAMLASACLEPQPAPNVAERPSTEFEVTELAGGFDLPWSVAPLPDGGALVTERKGTMKRVSPDGGVADVSGAPAVYFAPGGQAGLFDVVLDPGFAETGKVWISYAGGTPEANATALATGRLDGVVLEDLTEVWRATEKDTANHFGGKIVALPDGTVALTTGDGFVYREAAQDLDNTMGKVVRLNADGSVPEDNPRGAVWSYGHRNVQGLALDSATGELWEHEHGPRGGDELNLIEAGQNYGWPVATEGRDYNGARVSPFDEVEGMRGPVHGWTPSIAPSGLVIYRGGLFPEWQGDALVGALAGKALHRIDLENGASVGEEKLLGDLGVRIRDVREAPDGSVWVLTNEGAESRLLRVAPKG